MKWLRIGLASLAFGPLAYFGLLVVAMLHGDCGLESGGALDACLREKRIVVLICAAVAVGCYTLLVRRLWRWR